MNSRARFGTLWLQALTASGRQRRNHNGIKTLGHSMRHQANLAFTRGNLCDPSVSFVRSMAKCLFDHSPVSQDGLFMASVRAGNVHALLLYNG